MTLKIGLFVEDEAHKRFIHRLLARIIEEHSSLEIDIIERSSSGGHGKVVSEFGTYLRDLHGESDAYFDAVIVGTDANCIGFAERRKRLEKEAKRFPGISVAYAIPDPHIERWFLLDSAAFKKALGVGCRAPDQKCSRDRYKNELRQAVSQRGPFAPLGGIEYAEDIVEHLDMKTASKDKSFGQFVKDVRRLLKSWGRSR
jgi:hypothetical protein